MYQENAPKGRGAFLPILGMITAGFLLLCLPHWIGWTQFVWVYELFILCGTVAGIYWLIRRRVCEYSYLIVGDEVVIRGRLGSRETIVAQCSGRDVVSFTPWSPQQASSVRLRGRSFGVFDKKQAWLLIYRDGEEQKGVLFQPSRRFVELLQQIIS